MKTRKENAKPRRAFTRIELLVVVGVVVVVIGLLIPLFNKGHSPPTAIRCIQNLRSITLGLQWLADDNDQKPLLLSAEAAFQYGKSLARNPGGIPTLAGSGFDELWKLYLALHPYVKDPHALRCPFDPQFRNPSIRAGYQMATTNPLAYYSTSSNAFSYFLAVDAKRDPASAIVAGDSHLASNPIGTDKALGEVELEGEKRIRGETAKDMRWTKSRHAGQGVVAFGDGHAEILTSARLRTVWANPTNNGVRIWLPN